MEEDEEDEYQYPDEATTMQSVALTLRNNTTLEITFPDSSLKIEVKYQNSDLVVLASHKDASGRDGEIYKTGE